jgi:hypothetical protein
LQDPSAQAPLLHTAEALANEHTVVQLPQCSTSLFRFDSQPFDTALSQLPNPGLQLIVQAPVLQAAVPLVPLHTVPHAPQFATLVLALVSQPSLYRLLQSLYGAVHACTAQVVEMHAGVPLGTVHTVLHEPHALTLLVMAVSQPSVTFALQLPQPEAHAIEQLPPVHVAEPWLVLHTVPHVPQLPTFELVFVSQPLTALPSQFA